MGSRKCVSAGNNDPDSEGVIVQRLDAALGGAYRRNRRFVEPETECQNPA